MNDPTNLPRVYGDEEIGRILKRATELQHREPTAPSSAGVTLAELEEIAAEAGIDPAYLRRAAMEVDSGVADPSFWARVVGDDVMIVRDVTLPGELDSDGFERIVATIQAASREHGQPSLLGRTLTWRAETSNKTRTIQLVVSSHAGQTRVRLEENLTQTAVGLFAGITTGFGVGAGLGVGIPIGLEVLGSTLFAAVAPFGFVGLSFVASRAIYRALVGRRRRAVNELFDRTVAEAQAAIAATVADSRGAIASSVRGDAEAAPTPRATP
jgi:hypothetical protein